MAITRRLVMAIIRLNGCYVGILEKLGWTHGVDRWDGPVGWVLGLDPWTWAQGQDLNKVKTSKLLANVCLLAQ